MPENVHDTLYGIVNFVHSGKTGMVKSYQGRKIRHSCCCVIMMHRLVVHKHGVSQVHIKS